jgi:hypothetical protein
MTVNRLEQKNIQCPYCWESINVLIDCSIEAQEYIEDCQVCCHPINFNVQVDEDGYPNVNVSGDES